jgi:hypothetical protein
LNVRAKSRDATYAGAVAADAAGRVVDRSGSVQPSWGRISR